MPYHQTQIQSILLHKRNNIMSYEILNVVFPLVKIRCHDENGEEEITVLEDITGESLVSLNDRCEDAYKDWVRDR